MNREIYTTDGKYTVCPLTDADRDNYVELHRQINGDSTLYLNPYCKDIMWEHTLKGENKEFSIFDSNGEYCGSMELQRPASDTPEIGIDLLVSKRNKGIAPKVVKMLARRAYEDKPVEYYLIRISSNNPHSRHVFEKMGAVPIGTEEGTFKTFMKSLGQVVDETKVDDELQNKLKKYFGEGEDVEEEIVYRYKLTPDLFLE